MIGTTTTLLMLCGIAISFTSYRPSTKPQKPVHDRRVADRPKGQTLLHTIIIDPGHGGFDPGCHGLIAKEKDVALAISLKLGKALQQAYPGIKIVYTRTTDIMPGNKPTVKEGIWYRAELANREKGDLFICI